MSKFFAPGLPDKNIKPQFPSISSPTKFEFVLQDHHAKNQHFDLRLGDPMSGVAYSWVVRSWPRPGEKVQAIEQPGHCLLPGTLVDGMAIKDFVVNKKSEVSSLDSENIVKKEIVTNWSISKKEKRSIIKLQYKGNHGHLTNLFCTEGHKIYTSTGIKFAKDLTTDDKVLWVEDGYTEDQKQVLYGSLLGDGHISKNGGYKEAHCLKQSFYIKYKAKIFNQHVSSVNIYAVNSQSRMSKDTHIAWLTLKTTNYLKALRKSLYINGIKTLSKEFLDNINPLALAIWYMDDGSIMYRTKNGLSRLSGVQLSSMGFTEAENKLLQNMLLTKFNISSYLIYSKRYKNPFIRINQVEAYKLFELISKYIPIEFEYKINVPIGVSEKLCKICKIPIHPKYKVCDSCIIDEFQKLNWPSQSEYAKIKGRLSSSHAIYRRFKKWPNNEFTLESNKSIDNEIKIFECGNSIKEINSTYFKTTFPINITKVERVNKVTEVYNLNVFPTHNYVANGIIVGNSIPYMDFKGTIESGYGKGTVAIADRDKVEVIKSTPDKITFHKYTGSGIEKYTIFRTNGDQWLLLNHTTSNIVNKAILAAPKYKMKSIESYDSTDFIAPKIDGAYATAILRPDKTPILLSSRFSKKTQMPIEYTPKIFGMLNTRVPQTVGNTILKTEVFSVNSQGKELPNRILGGMLNANVWKSRDMQTQHKSPLQVAITDVVKYKGKNVSNLPIQERYKIIEQISKDFPILKNPLELEKRYNFKEGKVVWRNDVPYKLKYKPDYDVYVKEIFANKHNERAGGFRYSLSPDGPIVGNVGTGFTHAELDDMLKNPQDYVGRVAKIKAMEQHPSGAYRSPSMISWHTDK